LCVEHKVYVLIEAPVRSAAGLFPDSQSLPDFFPKFDLGSDVPSREAGALELGIKRVADILLASLGLLALSPMLLVIALTIRIKSPGPIIYKSKRIGKNQKPFYMYKFRTMVPNAEQMRDDLCKEANLHAQLFKIKADHRITPIGHFLRTYSLDEFPQLVNVIKGEMSLVGPRPYIPQESALFRAPYTARFSVTPGITGPWQVGGRSDLSFQELCELELSYVQNWSLWTDTALLLKTIPSVLLKKGAY
jgi:lipopolysaccharide/colanic/teichoic acid biosynthesis glycosyltransferase